MGASAWCCLYIRVRPSSKRPSEADLGEDKEFSKTLSGCPAALLKVTFSKSVCLCESDGGVAKACRYMRMPLSLLRLGHLCYPDLLPSNDAAASGPEENSHASP